MPQTNAHTRMSLRDMEFENAYEAGKKEGILLGLGTSNHKEWERGAKDEKANMQMVIDMAKNEAYQKGLETGREEADPYCPHCDCEKCIEK